MHDTLERLFRYKAWANSELLTVLAGLGSASPITGLAIQALSHSYVIDQIFAARLKGQAHGYTSITFDTQPSLTDLSTWIRQSDQEYVEYVEALDSASLAQRIGFTFTDDGTQGSMSREEMLMHVIIHGVGHRGQISALLLMNGLKPAQDGFTRFLHEAEAADRGRVAA